jgi:hypothetical protein
MKGGTADKLTLPEIAKKHEVVILRILQHNLKWA